MWNINQILSWLSRNAILFRCRHIMTNVAELRQKLQTYLAKNDYRRDLFEFDEKLQKSIEVAKRIY